MNHPYFSSILVFLGCTVIFLGCNHHKKNPLIHNIPHTPDIIVDGRPDDWTGQGLKIPFTTNVWGESAAESFSALVSLTWDEQFLYLLADVKDDILYQDRSGPMWRNDGMELFIASGKGSGEMIHYLIAPALTPDFPLARVDKRDYRTNEQFQDVDDLKIASQITSEGYILEIAVPFGSLDINPQKGDTIALNFYLVDADSASHTTKYSLHYHDNTYSNHDALWEFTLAGPGLQQSMETRAWLTDTTFYKVNLISFTGHKKPVRLVNGENELGKTLFDQNGNLHRAAFKFERSQVADFNLPLELKLGDHTLSAIQWNDIPLRYVNISAPNRFENEIRIFEREDAQNFPPSGAVLFIGSSSIRLWETIAEDLPGLTYINRGFGGSQTSDVLHFFDRIVTPYNPSKIVFFAGTNDLAAGRSPGEVVNNTEEFIQRVNEINPNIQVFILSNTIAVSRKHLYERYHETNRQLIDMLNGYHNAYYIDVTQPGLRANGQPRPEIYTADSLHLNRAGYRMWGNIVRPFLSVELE